MEQFDFHKTFATLFQPFSISKEITFDEILNSKELPDYAKKFISNEAERQIFEISTLIKELPILPTDSAEFETFLSSFLSDLKKYISFKNENFQNILLQAIKLRYNFLRKPNSTLLFFVFGNSFQKNKTETLTLLDYFSDYHRIIQKLREKILQTSNEFISVYTFNKYLAEIETEIFTTASNEELIEFFNPIFEFFIEDSEKSTVPVDFFIDLFNDLNLEHVSNSFKIIRQKDNQEFLNKDTFSQVLLEINQMTKSFVENKITESAQQSFKLIVLTTLEPFAFSIPEEIPKLDRKLLIQQEVEPTTIVAKQEEIEEIKNLLTQFESSSTERDTEQEEILDETVTELAIGTIEEVEGEVHIEIPSEQEIEIPKSEIEFIDELAEKDFEVEKLKSEEITYDTKEEETIQSHETYPSTQEPLQGHSGEDITFASPQVDETIDLKTDGATTELETKIPSIPSFNSLIDETKRKQFIDELFYAIEEEYNNLISNIDNCQNFEQAMDYINNYFTEFGIFQDMPIAVEFVELVKQKFAQSNKTE